MLKKILFVTMLLAITLAACGAKSAEPALDYYGGDYAYEEEMAASAPMEAEAYYGETDGARNLASSTAATSAERMVIKNAELAIIAADPVASMESIGQMAESMGGFVVTSNLYQRTLSSGEQVPQGDITVRVPAEELDEALAQIKADAVQVENENVSGQDVTSTYTDLASRLRNLEAAEAQLQAIMEEAQKTEDVLNIFNQLVTVREQIEVIKGQMKYYEESAALSMISVSITADEAVQPIQVGGWQPGGVAKDAIEALIRTLQTLVDIGIWFVICVLPIALIIGLPLFLAIRWAIRKQRKNKAQKQSGESPVQGA